MKKLAIIIVNYNVCYFLEQALKSVQKAIVDIDAEVFVVDNNSIDNSVALVKEKFPSVKLIENKENVGFSKANNQAIHASNAEYVLLLNPDTVVERNTFEKCIEFMDNHPDAGGLGVKMVDGKGQFLPESKRGLPTPSVAFYKISGLSTLFPKSKTFGQYHLGYLSNDETHQIDVLSGAFMLMRQETLDKTGLLDEDYFMYGEDIDLSYRITQAGYKNYYFPHARIIHYKGESTKKTSINYVFIFYRAMIIFAQKHFSNQNAKLFSGIINAAIYAKASFDITINFIKNLLPTAFSAGTIWGLMVLTSHYWETSYKPTDQNFPPEYFSIIIPSYIIVWLMSNYFNGGNDKPTSVYKIIRGALVGGLIISAVSNYVDVYRYSKTLILIGSALSTLVITLQHLFLHYLEYNNFNFSTDKTKRIAVVGTENEFSRVKSILEKLKLNVQPIGFISINKISQSVEGHIGNISQVDDIISLHKVDEVIFCSKDIDTQAIISIMSESSNKLVDFKIIPEQSDYIIGSNSKDQQGDLYTIEIKLNISKNSCQRNKRVLDIAFSLGCLLLLPIGILFIKAKKAYLQNIFSVLFGKKTWVGFSEYKDSSLPKIKKGIISPAIKLEDHENNIQIKRQLDLLYAKDYQVADDFKLLVKFFPHLGHNTENVA